jgi:hypothetical protein
VRLGHILSDQTIRTIFDEIPKEKLNSVSISWIKRFKWAITNEEKYFYQ